MGTARVTPIAATGEQFLGFDVFVPSINDDGVVAFTATLAGGRTGVFCGDGASVGPVYLDGAAGPVVSHPDIDSAGNVCFYVEARVPVKSAVLHVDRATKRVRTLAEVGEVFQRIGPLGPTMIDGAVAFRADTWAGDCGAFLARDDEVVRIADTRGAFLEFDGLPVLDGAGRVVFRATLNDEAEVIAASIGGPQVLLVATGNRFFSVGRFPAVNSAGTVVFAATLQGGGTGIFALEGGELRTVIDGTGAYESFRGGLVWDDGAVVFYANPHGGPLGIFRGPDPVADCLLIKGQALFGTTVTDFALNPVSMNGPGQIAVRVKVATGDQLILRLEP